MKGSKRALHDIVESPNFSRLAGGSASEAARKRIFDLERTVQEFSFWRELDLARGSCATLHKFIRYFEREDARDGELVPSCDCVFEELIVVL